MEQMKPLYLKYRGTQHLKSFVKHSETDFGSYFKFKEYNLSVAYDPKFPSKPLAAGMVYEIEDNEFIIVGMMCSLTFMQKSGENVRVDFLKLEEGDFSGHEWKPGRILNGDEKMALKLGDYPTCYRVRLYKY